MKTTRKRYSVKEKYTIIRMAMGGNNPRFIARQLNGRDAGTVSASLNKWGFSVSKLLSESKKGKKPKEIYLSVWPNEKEELEDYLESNGFAAPLHTPTPRAPMTASAEPPVAENDTTRIADALERIAACMESRRQPLRRTEKYDEAFSAIGAALAALQSKEQ